MSQWGSSDSGILRKNKADDNFDQLLVFGYSCKIFRDDEKALYIDQGKHLIPWMGDESLKIDRYDGRGTLSDLKQYEASREGYDALRWLGLSESEKKLEELCDSERYYSLEINEEEEEMYKEEVAKRQKTNAFAFDYNNPQPSESDQKEGVPTVPEKEEEDEPYVPSPVLDVPVDINMPKTVKEYARIEKTALFVCRQGPQMEILIKAKQADNPQFSFLTVQDPLYKFYRHVLSAFKNGRYRPQCDKKTEEAKPSLSQDDQESHYLHPSLISASAKPDTPSSQTPPLPSVPYRPTADCSYSQLVTRIQGAGLSSNGEADAQGIAAAHQQSVVAGQIGAATSQMQIMSQMNLEQLYHQYYYVQQFYEYWRHTVVNSEQGAMYAGLPLNFSQLDPNMQSYIHQLAWAQFVQHHHKQILEAQQTQANANSNSYAQIVSNLNKDGGNPYTANVPQLPPPEPSKDQQIVIPVEEKNDEERTVTLVKYDENEVKKPLLSLAAAYGSESGSDSDSTDSEVQSKASVKQKVEEKIEVYRVPSGELQTVIDKMAEYVSKNGDQFEEIIKQKGDPRFDFLNEGHEFNKYYSVKLGELRGGVQHEKVKQVEEPKQQKPKPKKIIGPVSFSIKKSKEDPPKEIKSALPMEESSDEESYLDNMPSISSAVNAATKSVASNNNSISQKTSNPKVMCKIGQPVSTMLPQHKVAQITLTESSIASEKSAPGKENTSVLVDRSSPSGSRRSKTSSKSKSPSRQSKSGSYSPTIVKRSRTPKKRSRSRTKSPVLRKRAKSRSETPSKKSPVRVKDSPKKISQPKEEQISHTKKKKSPIIDTFDSGDINKNIDGNTTNGVLQGDDPILEMMQLEKDAKTAEEKAADAKEKARQLERKRKAAMFLKLKSVQTKPPEAPTVTDKTENLSLLKAHRAEMTSEVNSRRSPASISSRRNSDDSVVSIRSTSASEKSKPIEDLVLADKSRSESSYRSRSKEKRKGSKKHRKTKDRDRSRDRDDDERKIRRERDKKKKSHKRKHSKSKKKSKKHKRSRSLSVSRSRSKSISVLRSSRSKSRSISEKSHISIDSS